MQLTAKATGVIDYTGVAHSERKRKASGMAYRCTVSYRFNHFEAPRSTNVGIIAKIELDSHEETCCAGDNWSLMELTGGISDTNPFLE